MNSLLAPGSTIGILGGGQLGRMLSLAAARLGLKCHIYDPDENAPAGQVSADVTHAAWDDADALRRFAQSVDVVTFEFENIPTASLDLIEAIVPIRPRTNALATSQDRLIEKNFLTGLGLATAPFADIPDADALPAALEETGLPAILKTRRFGYDGKGQARVTDATSAPGAFASLNGAPAIAEGHIAFTAEISVIAARGMDGSVACYDPGLNVHHEGILHTTTVPAPVPASVKTDAVLLAGRILNALDYVGVMGVELFVTPQGLLVNEIAPRVHNSGHWTQNGCTICQFEQHIRAIAGWPLGPATRHSDVEMLNLIGDDGTDISNLAATGAGLHLYGKAEARAGRKMGHLNRLIPRD